MAGLSKWVCEYCGVINDDGIACKYCGAPRKIDEKLDPWTCRFCGTVNYGGEVCSSCYSKRRDIEIEPVPTTENLVPTITFSSSKKYRRHGIKLTRRTKLNLQVFAFLFVLAVSIQTGMFNSIFAVDTGVTNIDITTTTTTVELDKLYFRVFLNNTLYNGSLRILIEDGDGYKASELLSEANSSGVFETKKTYKCGDKILITPDNPLLFFVVKKIITIKEFHLHAIFDVYLNV